MHYFKRNIGDYHKKAGRLSMLEHGAYTLLMDACYDREKFPTLEQALDWCWARSDGEIAAVKFVLDKFFTLDGDQYTQQRIADEIDGYHQKSKVNKQIALDREAARRTQRERTEHETCTDHHLTTNQEPLTINQEPEDQEPLSPPATPAVKPERKEPAFKRILEIYNEICKGRFKGAAEITTERKKNIAKCWNRTVNGKLVFQSGQFWSDYFTWCLRDPHWCGETGNWKASLEFVTRTSSVDRIIDEMTLEGVFNNEPA